ncbi:biotin/lipoyl-binding protein [bacterium]|nr:biotin/lipoyl-binding protein [bacterium]
MGEYIFNIGGKEYKVDVKGITGNLATVVIDGKEVGVTIKQFGKRETAPPPRKARKRMKPEVVQAAPQMPAAKVSQQTTTSSKVTLVHAPIPGIILKILVKEGDSVKTGQDIILMEAMKMENQIQATASGVVAKIKVKVDDAVQQEDVLIEINPT